MGKINSLGTDAGLHSYTTLKYVVTTNGIISNLWLQAKHAPHGNKVPDVTGSGWRRPGRADIANLGVGEFARYWQSVEHEHSKTSSSSLPLPSSPSLEGIDTH